MGREIVKYFSASGSKTSSIPLENPERVRGRGSVEGQPGARDGGEGQREKIQNEQRGDKKFEGEGGARVQHQ